MEEVINDLFICQCYNTEYQLIFSYFPEEKGDADKLQSVVNYLKS